VNKGKTTASPLTETTTSTNHFDLENKIKTFESDPSIFQKNYIQNKENKETAREREIKKMRKDKFVNDLLHLFRTRDY
jgi:hypothetical protein